MHKPCVRDYLQVLQAAPITLCGEKAIRPVHTIIHEKLIHTRPLQAVHSLCTRYESESSSAPVSRVAAVGKSEK